MDLYGYACLHHRPGPCDHREAPRIRAERRSGTNRDGRTAEDRSLKYEVQAAGSVIAEEAIMRIAGLCAVEKDGR